MVIAARAGDRLVEPPPHSFDGLLAAVLEGRTTMWCELPPLDGSGTVAEHLSVRGWAYCRAGLESVAVTFDDEPLATKTGFWRPDVDRALPGIEGAVSGFAAHLDVRRRRRGEHRLAVVARGRDGRSVGREAPVNVDPDLPYRRWLEDHRPPGPADPSISTLEVVIVGGGDQALWRSAVAQAAGRVRHTDLPDELRRLAERGAGITVLVEPGGVLAPHALALLSQAIACDPTPDLVYADEDAIVADGGRGAAFLKPGWSPELLMATDYLGPLLALSSQAARAALEAAPEPPATLYEAALALVDFPMAVSRVPEPLYTAHAVREPADDDRVAAALEAVAARRGRRLRTSRGVRRGMREVCWEVEGDPLVSIVIPSRYARGLLRECLASIAQRSSYRRLEVVVVDSSGGEVAAALPALGEVPRRVVTYEGDFNYSRAVNLGARTAAGDHLLFLNDDTEVLAPESIERLLEHAQSPGVGAVGCKLVYDDGTIQHGGVGVAGGARGAWHLYLGFDGHEAGYRDTLTVARNTSAVTAACLMVPAPAFAEIGGFDEAYPLDYGDTDFCLRTLDAGRRVVFTPHAVLLHRESATRTPRLDDAGLELSERWGERFADGDRFLHPAFADGDSYVLDASAASRPVCAEPARDRVSPMQASTTRPQVDAPQLRCQPSLEDGPVYFHNELVLNGWALAPTEIVQLDVELDGRSVEVSTGRDPHVAEDHPEIGRAPKSGFEVRVDCRDWPRGEHVLAVTATDAEGRRTGQQSSLRVDPYELPPGSFEEIKAGVTAGRTVMWCDEPALDGTTTASRRLTVRGWAHGSDGIEAVLVTIDRRHRYEATLGQKRPDLSRSLELPEVTNAGFQVNLDLRGQDPGNHHISVVAVGGDGRLVGAEGVVRFEGGAAVPAPAAPAVEAPPPGAAGGGARERPSPERLVPEEARGRLVVAEHQARYRWAAQAARGRDALDAGCGVGYGAAILAHAGARSVTGVDRSPEAILNARERVGNVAELLLADLQELPLEDGAFDLVTCFEAIEHLVDPDRALDELRRVLRPGGVLLISSPHRGVYAPGNPHHVHEYTPSELHEALSARFAHVTLYRQHAHLASLLCDDGGFRSADAEQVLDAEVRKIAASEGGELYTVAAAGDAELPALRGVAVVGDVFDYKELAELAWTLEERAIVAEAEASASQAEARLSVAARERAEQLLQASAHALAAQQASISWRMTAPLRWAKARARARAGR